MFVSERRREVDMEFHKQVTVFRWIVVLGEPFTVEFHNLKWARYLQRTRKHTNRKMCRSSHLVTGNFD